MRWARRISLGWLLVLAGCIGGAANRPALSTVETDPDGASVFVEGGFVGTSPATFYLPSLDRVSVRIELPGYMPLADVLVRSKEVPAEPNEGVGWDDLYYYPLVPKGR